MIGNKKAVRVVGKILFILYVCFIIYFLIFSDWYGRSGVEAQYHYNFELFKEIKRFWYNRSTLGWAAVIENLLGNVLIFVPFGIFLPMASKYRSFFATVFYSFSLSFCVETFQLLTKVGSFDVDDLFLNTMGGILGYVGFMAYVMIRRRHGSKKRSK